MDEYIKKQDAIDCLWANCDEVGSAIVPDMEAIPAADVQPVVYCEDCVHSACDGYICMNSFHTGKTFPNCFCNYGERKDEEQPPELTEQTVKKGERQWKNTIVF